MKRFFEVVLYNVPVGLNDIETQLKGKYSDVISSRRILKFPNWYPTTLIRVRVTSFECQRRFLAEGCQIGKYWYRAELSRKRVTTRRCYNCQEISFHIARNCPNVQKCMKCSDNHRYEYCDSSVKRCANCNGPHLANSPLCQHWTDQNQRSRQGHGWVNCEERWFSLNATLKDHFRTLTSNMNLLWKDVCEMKSIIRELLSRFMEPRPDPLNSSEMWDDYNLNENHNADELSATVLSPPVERIAMTNTILTPSESMDSSQHLNDPNISPGFDCDCDSVLLSPPRGGSCLPGSPNKQHVDIVNSESIVDAGNNIVHSSDTTVDAIFTDISVSDNSKCHKRSTAPYDPNDDPTYREYLARMDQLTEAEIMNFQNNYNPYMGEVLFRYSGGVICRDITVRSIDGALNTARPCNVPIKHVNTLEVEQIGCCAFHHLASVIRDSVDKSNLAESFKKWRTKDVSAYCENWQCAFYKAMEIQYGKLSI